MSTWPGAVPGRIQAWKSWWSLGPKSHSLSLVAAKNLTSNF